MVTLDSFKKLPLSKEVINKYKSSCKALKHIKPNANGYLYIDKDDNVAALIAVNEKNSTNWITALEIFDPYKNNGLSYKLLDVATNEFKATRLTVRKNNFIAKHVYEKYGFKDYNGDEYMKYMELGNNKYTNENAINESNSIYSSYYHLSKIDTDELKPSIPSNFLTKNHYENNLVKRVSFSPSINQCLMAMSRNITGEEFYVYAPENIESVKVVEPTKDQVPDIDITGEIWVLNNIKVKKLGKVRVIKDSGKDGHTYTYGNGQTAELYDWDYEMIEESNLSESYEVTNRIKNKRLDKTMKQVRENSDKLDSYRYAVEYLKDSQPVNEGMIHNGSDICYRYEDFKSGDLNVLLVLGQPGCDKDFSIELAKRHDAVWVALDHALFNKDYYNIEDLKVGDSVMYAFFKSSRGSRFFMTQEEAERTYDPFAEYAMKVLSNALFFILHLAREYKNEKFVIDCNHWLSTYFAPDMVSGLGKECAIIIKGGSALHSKKVVKHRLTKMNIIYANDRNEDKHLMELAKKREIYLDEWRKECLKLNAVKVKNRYSLLEACSDSDIYRYTYDDEGIYEAFKKNAPSEVWDEFLNSKAANWLSKPDKYPKGYTSYFTYDGKCKFDKNTLPIMSKYLDKDKIELTKVDSSTYLRTHEPVYSDKYQVIVDEECGFNEDTNKSITEFSVINDMHIYLRILRPRFDEYTTFDESFRHDKEKNDVISIKKSLSDKDKDNLNITNNDFSTTANRYFIEYDGKTPVAYFIIDNDDDNRDADVSLAVRPEYQSKGYGTKVANRAMDYINKNLDRYNKIYWATKPDNIASQKLAKKCGFSIVRDDKQWKTYALDCHKIITDEFNMNEAYVFNEDNIYYNKDKFDSGEINLCFITGHSGSGKSTLASNNAKADTSDNTDWVSLDDVIFNKECHTLD